MELLKVKGEFIFIRLVNFYGATRNPYQSLKIIFAYLSIVKPIPFNEYSSTIEAQFSLP